MRAFRLPRSGPPATELPLHRAQRRSCLRAISLAPLAAAFAGCGGGGVFDEPNAKSVAAGADSLTKRPAEATSRRWHMGFGITPPRLNLDTFLQDLSLWQQRADMAAHYCPVK